MNGNSDISARKERVLLGEPIQAPCGAILHPLRMRQYERWLACKKSIILRQSTLPAKYAILPYLSALHAIDADNGYALGLTQSLRMLIAMATLQPLENINILVSAQDHTKLAAIAYQSESGMVRIEPKDFSQVRQIIAEQNGEELPDESENPELVQAEKDIAEAQSADIEYDFETMLDSVGYVGRVPKKELLDMTIRDFDHLRQAIDRDKKYTAFLAAEMGGIVKFKGGNPAPSWCFNRRKKESAALEPLADFASRTGINTAATT